MEVSLNDALSKSVLTRIIDYCFSNGLKSLSDDETWNGLLVALQGFGIRTSVPDLKAAWVSVVDAKLNDICKTNVKPKEAFHDWEPYWTWNIVSGRMRMLAVLSERLKAVFDERLTRRGYFTEQDYKTLAEEEAEKTCRQKQRSLDMKHASLADKLEQVVNSVASTSLELQSDGKPLENYSFFVLEQPGCAIDYFVAKAMKQVILHLGGKLCDDLKTATVLVQSANEKFNSFVLADLDRHPLAISISTFWSIIIKIRSGKPFDVSADHDIHSENRAFREEEITQLGLGIRKDIEVTVDETKCGNVVQRTNEKDDMTSNCFTVNEPEIKQGRNDMVKTSNDNSCIEKTSLLSGLDPGASVTGVTGCQGSVDDAEEDGRIKKRTISEITDTGFDPTRPPKKRKQPYRDLNKSDLKILAILIKNAHKQFKAKEKFSRPELTQRSQEEYVELFPKDQQQNVPNEAVKSFLTNKAVYEGSMSKIEDGFNKINETRSDAEKLTVEELDAMKKFLLHAWEEKKKNIDRREANKLNQIEED